MENEKMLRCFYVKHVPTIKLMDQFESVVDGKQKYDILKLEDVFCLNIDDCVFRVSLYIKRLSHGKAYIASNLTFSKFKTAIMGKSFGANNAGQFHITREAYHGLEKRLSEGMTSGDYYFETPVQFNAQNSSNRMGYGTRYYGSRCVYEGTRYGEVTNYMCVGVQYSLFYSFKRPK